jgi:hypothetical protein
VSATAILLAVETAVLALALLFLVALLRSHAEILRRLAALEGPAPAARPAGFAAAAGATATITGRTPGGDAVQVSLQGRTLLAFLSSGCAACGPLWEDLQSGAVRHGAGTRLVVVTHGPERESPARLPALSGHDVVMSSAAYEQFAVPVTPHFVLVQDGRELGRGSAGSWDQIARLLADAEADASGERDTSERAERAEQALASAGITAGDPSLYPSRPQPCASC